MNGARTPVRSFLAYGFGISVVVHLLAFAFVHPVPSMSAEEPEPDVLLLRTSVPAPPPTPRATPTPAATPQPTPPRRTGLGGEPPNAHTDGERGEPPGRDAAPVEPDTPAVALQQGISGIVNVIGSLDAQSRWSLRASRARRAPCSTRRLSPRRVVRDSVPRPRTPSRSRPTTSSASSSHPSEFQPLNVERAHRSDARNGAQRGDGRLLRRAVDG